MADVKEPTWRIVAAVLIGVLITAGGHFLVLGKDVATRQEVDVEIGKSLGPVNDRLSATEQEIDHLVEMRNEDRKILLEMNGKLDLLIRFLGFQSVASTEQ